MMDFTVIVQENHELCCYLSNCRACLEAAPLGLYTCTALRCCIVMLLVSLFQRVVELRHASGVVEVC